MNRLSAMKTLSSASIVHCSSCWCNILSCCRVANFQIYLEKAAFLFWYLALDNIWYRKTRCWNKFLIIFSRQLLGFMSPKHGEDQTSTKRFKFHSKINKGYSCNPPFNCFFRITVTSTNFISIVQHSLFI